MPDTFKLFVYILTLIALLMAGAVFAMWPELDLQVAAMFYDGETFFLKDSVFVSLIDRFGMWPMRFVAIGALLAWLYSFNAAAPDWTVSWRNGLLFLAMVAILGPGLVIESGFKSHYGRARPHQVEQFGGEQAFTPFYMPADSCETNCSFPSGHTAAGFYFLALGLVLSGRLKKEAYLGGLMLGGLNGYARVAQGAHFLSDVIFAGLITWAVILLLDAAFNRFGLKPFKA